jgi:hypothetical protein
LTQAIKDSIRQERHVVTLDIAGSKDKFTSYEKDFVTEPEPEGSIHPDSTDKSILEAEQGTTSIMDTPPNVDDSLAINPSDDSLRTEKKKRKRYTGPRKRPNRKTEAGSASGEGLEQSPDASLSTTTEPTGGKGATTSFSGPSNGDHGVVSTKSTVSLPVVNAPHGGNLDMNETPVDESLQSAPTLATEDSKFGGNSGSSSGSSPKLHSSQEQCQSSDSKAQDNASDPSCSTYGRPEAESNQSESKISSDETTVADKEPSQSEGKGSNDKTMVANTESSQSEGKGSNDKALKADTNSSEGTESNDNTPKADTTSSQPEGKGSNDKALKADRKSSQPEGKRSNDKSPKADRKTSQAKGKGSSDKNLKADAQGSPGSSSPKDPEVPIISLKDPEEWPALAPTKAPASTIVDGKPPVITGVPVIQGYSTVACANNSSAVVPAAPVNTKRRRVTPNP